MHVYIKVIPALLCIIIDVDDVIGSRSTLRSWGYGLKEKKIYITRIWVDVSSVA